MSAAGRRCVRGVAADRVRARPARVGRRQDSSLGLLAMLVVLFVVLAFVSPYFLTATNLLNIGRAIAIVGIVAVGETIVIISRRLRPLGRLDHGRGRA